ncbi:MAG: hypothetical protein J6Y23_06260 [Prevotella sp.]|nr:hypothetical protein [Prevotella sp.]
MRLEVDFVVNQASQRYYIQSALTIPDKEKEDQETQSLVNIDDFFQENCPCERQYQALAKLKRHPDDGPDGFLAE